MAFPPTSRSEGGSSSKYRIHGPVRTEMRRKKESFCLHCFLPARAGYRRWLIEILKLKQHETDTVLVGIPGCGGEYGTEVPSMFTRAAVFLSRHIAGRAR